MGDNLWREGSAGPRICALKYMNDLPGTAKTLTMVVSAHRAKRLKFELVRGLSILGHKGERKVGFIRCRNDLI